MTVATSPRCCAGSPTGTSSCWATSAAAVHDGQASVDPASRLGVLRLRTDVLPQLTGDDDLLVLAQATMPSFLRYGAYPYIVVVRENAGGLERSGRPSSTGSSGCSPWRRPTPTCSRSR